MDLQGRPLEGKVALVTGGASGIGFGISHRLARDGDAVAILDLDAEGAVRAAKDIVDSGGMATAHTADVSQRPRIESALSQVHAQLGPVEILVNNAGIDCITPFATMDVETWNRVFTINMDSVFHCTQLVLPDMFEVGWGRIINISSSSAQRGASHMVAYSSSKGAMISFTRSLALELGDKGITVNNVPPGFIETPMLRRSFEGGFFEAGSLVSRAKEAPVGRGGMPEDIAAAVAFLARPDSGYITGQTLGVNGGRVPD
jgi:NAD(P)-dependent dehydrogenase (short-subunit alcohol dehydrogenase family)